MFDFLLFGRALFSAVWARALFLLFSRGREFTDLPVCLAGL